MVHFDIEKLDELPTHESINAFHKNNNSWERYQYSYNQIWNTASDIIHASVGRPISSLRRRLKPFIKKLHRYSFDYFLSRQIEVVYKENGEYFIAGQGKKYSKYYDFYFVDEDDILRFKESTTKTKKYKSKTKTQLKKEKSDRRRSRKYDKKTRGLLQLYFINKPGFFSEYRNLKSEIHRIYDYYNRYINALKPLNYEPANPQKWLNYRKYDSKIAFRQWLSSQNKLKTLEEHLIAIHNGDFSYLEKQLEYKSYKKLCPHFENTQL